MRTRCISPAVLAAAIATAAALAPADSSGQRVYKCPKGDGFEYTNAPCHDPVKTWEGAAPADQDSSPRAETGDQVRVIDWACSSNSAGIFATGTVRNATLSPMRFLRINVSFYDRAGNLVDTGFSFVRPDPLPPNMVGQFKVFGPRNATQCKLDTWEWKPV